jgi:nickel-dependent lactate racemase
MEGRYDVDNDFRRELDEIAAAVGLNYLFTAHVDGLRNLVRLVCGDWRVFYPREVEFARQTYAAPPPRDADVVISNSYPIDLSLTFMRSKGIIPLLRAAPGASRILLSGCAEGVGRHGLYPLERSSLERAQHLLRTAWFTRTEIPAKLRKRLKAKVQRGAGEAEPTLLPMRLFVSADGALPAGAGGFTLHRSWTRLVEDVRAEQRRDDLDVVVYPCAPLQVIDDGLR